jgi:hypothetical protein
MSINFTTTYSDLDVRVCNAEAFRLLEVAGMDVDYDFPCGEMSENDLHNMLQGIEDLIIAAEHGNSYPTWRIIRLYGKLSRFEGLFVAGLIDHINWS